MSYKEHALKEFELAGWYDPATEKYNDDMQGWVCTQVLELLDVFASHGHSGFSASYAVNLFTTLAKFGLVTPLTGEDVEWGEPQGESGYQQNKRLTSVFRDADGRAYDLDAVVHWEWYEREDGEMDKMTFYKGGHKEYIEFPYTQGTPRMVFVPTDKFPNEQLEK